MSRLFYCPSREGLFIPFLQAFIGPEAFIMAWYGNDGRFVQGAVRIESEGVSEDHPYGRIKRLTNEDEFFNLADEHSIKTAK